jgi:hypothetical protein
MSFVVVAHGNGCVPVDGRYEFTLTGLDFVSRGYEQAQHRTLNHAGRLSTTDVLRLEQCLRTRLPSYVPSVKECRTGIEPEYSYDVSVTDANGTRRLTFFRYPTPEYYDLVDGLWKETYIGRDMHDLALLDDDFSEFRDTGGVVTDSLQQAIDIGSRQMLDAALRH